MPVSAVLIERYILSGDIYLSSYFVESTGISKILWRKNEYQQDIDTFPAFVPTKCLFFHAAFLFKEKNE